MLKTMSRIAAVLGFAAIAPAIALAARPSDVHYRYRLSDSPPGFVGGSQLERGGPLAGYFQPVRITGPDKVKISLVVDDHFQEERSAPVTAGMLIGQVYRFRVTGIPLREGREVFPTVEVVNRLYPPVGMETKFPIPIELTREELEFALEGKYVTRVIYLEDPQTAIANRQGPGIPQPYFETLASEDPLQVADRLGRPMAILRLGSRLPDATTDMHRFAFGSPAFLEYREVQTVGNQSGLEAPPATIPLPNATERRLTPQPRTSISPTAEQP